MRDVGEENDFRLGFYYSLVVVLCNGPVPDGLLQPGNRLRDLLSLRRLERGVAEVVVGLLQHFVRLRRSAQNAHESKNVLVVLVGCQNLGVLLPEFVEKTDYDGLHLEHVVVYIRFWVSD